MTTQQSVDQTKTEAFLGKVLGDTSGLTTTIMASIGDRLGLFKQLAHGPATSAQLATRADINERYAHEWLGAMASAGYVAYDPASERFTLPAEHLPILAQENGPMFFGGVHQMLAGMVGPLNQLIRAFQYGGGVPQSAYDHNMWDGLERGALVADVGCGRGKALIKLRKPSHARATSGMTSSSRRSHRPPRMLRQRVSPTGCASSIATSPQACPNSMM